METLMIEAEGLTKRYGETQALGGIDLAVPAGTVLGLLGPNGAGKTTAVRILTTLATPDGGGARIAGHDVVREARQVRRSIGVTAQDTTLDEALTGRQNLRMVAELSGLRRSAAVARTRELLDRFELTYAADRLVKGYSGGMRRRLDLAAGLVTHPPVLFLDEPTTGLDPVARRAVWGALQRRRDTTGTTIVLITHNVLEAESVLDRVAVLESGRVIACDTPGQLKASVSGDVRLDLAWRHEPPADDPTVAMLAGLATTNGRRWTVRLDPATAREALGRLTTGAALAALDDFSLATPSLEDVYLTLGGASRDLERT